MLQKEIIANLRDEFYLVSVSKKLFEKYLNENYAKVFNKNDHLINTSLLLSPDELSNQKKLKNRLENICKLRLVIFNKDAKLVGWHYGEQNGYDEYRMRNSAILPEYRRQGIYSFLLKTVLELCTKEGFQVISSKHAITHNNIIIPKLKSGFIIVGTEISEKYGSLISLQYHVNKIRRQLFDYRSGILRYQNEWEILRSK